MALEAKVGPVTIVARATAPALSIEDLRQRAGRRLPRTLWAYVENGADDERTLRANQAAWDAYRLRQRVLAGIAEVDLSTTVAGLSLAAPLLLAPVAFGRAAWARGRRRSQGRGVARRPPRALDGEHPLAGGGRRRDQPEPPLPALPVG